MRVAHVSCELVDGARRAAQAGHEVHLVSDDPRDLRPGLVHQPLAPLRADHRYLSDAQAHADRVYDTLRSLHAATPLDVIEFVDAEGWTVVRAQRLLGEFAGVRLVARAGSRPDADGTLDGAIERHLTDYSRRHASDGAAAGTSTGELV